MALFDLLAPIDPADPALVWATDLPSALSLAYDAGQGSLVYPAMVNGAHVDPNYGGGDSTSVLPYFDDGGGAEPLHPGEVVLRPRSGADPYHAPLTRSWFLVPLLGELSSSGANSVQFAFLKTPGLIAAVEAGQSATLFQVNAAAAGGYLNVRLEKAGAGTQRITVRAVGIVASVGNAEASTAALSLTGDGEWLCGVLHVPPVGSGSFPLYLQSEGAGGATLHSLAFGNPLAYAVDGAGATERALNGVQVGGAEIFSGYNAAYPQLVISRLAVYNAPRVPGAEAAAGPTTALSLDYAEAASPGAKNDRLRGVAFPQTPNGDALAGMTLIRIPDLCSETEVSLTEIVGGWQSPRSDRWYKFTNFGEYFQHYEAGMRLYLCFGYNSELTGYNRGSGANRLRYPSDLALWADTCADIALYVATTYGEDAVIGYSAWNEWELFHEEAPGTPEGEEEWTPESYADLHHACAAAVSALYPAWDCYLWEGWTTGTQAERAETLARLQTLGARVDGLAAHSYDCSDDYAYDLLRPAGLMRTEAEGYGFADLKTALTEWNSSIPHIRQFQDGPETWAWSAAYGASVLDACHRAGAEFAVRFTGHSDRNEFSDLRSGGIASVATHPSAPHAPKPFSHVLGFHAALPAQVLAVTKTAGRHHAGAMAFRDADGTSLGVLIWHPSLLVAAEGPGSSLPVRVNVDNLPEGMAVASAYRVDRDHASVYESGSDALASEPGIVSLDSTGFSATLAPGSVLSVSLSAAPAAPGAADVGVLGASAMFSGGRRRR